MGMSDDLEAAIAEGATLVRIGTAIFGARAKDQARGVNVAMNVVFIGGGNMADALIGGLLKSGFAASQLRAVDVNGDARRRLARQAPDRRASMRRRRPIARAT